MTPEEIKAHLKRKYDELEADKTTFNENLYERHSLNLQETVLRLYQYTNVSGLKGMITDSELWATNLAYCNDSSEFHYGLKNYIDVITASIVGHAASVEVSVATELINRLSQKDRSDTYVCCLTRHDDQLSQWRAYGDRGYGYAVGFDFDRITNLFGVTSRSWVLYNKEAQTEYFNRVGVWLAQELTNSLDEDRENAVSDIADIVMEDISTGLPFYKHPKFHEEGEYRLFSSTREMASLFGVRDFPEYVREGQNTLIPYVKLFDKRDVYKRLPIREIVVGPKVDFVKAEQAIKILLKNHRYTDVIPIRPSEIPFV